MKLIFNEELHLYCQDKNIFCDSLQIAEEFEKQHKHILDSIERALETFAKINQPKFGLINFIKTTYKDSKNRKQPKYLLTKDGFSYLTMGYEGEKAARFKIAYIERFNQMEEFIKSLLQARFDFPALTEAIMMAHEEPKHYHFSNEFNMINRIVLGMDAKSFKKNHNLDDKEPSIRPYLTPQQIKGIETLQRIDVGLHEAKLDYEQRKEILTNSFTSRLRLVSVSAVG